MIDYRKLAEEIISNNYPAVGVRALQADENYIVGDVCRESYEWDYENDCSEYETNGNDGEKAGGTCATKVEINYPLDMDDVDDLAEALEAAVSYNYNVYRAKRQVIIAGSPNHDGVFEAEEIRIDSAKVIAVL